MIGRSRGEEEGGWLGMRADVCVEMHESMNKLMKTGGGCVQVDG